MNSHYKVIQFVLLFILTLVSLMLSFYFLGFIPPETYVYILENLYLNFWAAGLSLLIFLFGIWGLTPFFLQREPENTLVREGENGEIRVSLHAVDGLIHRFVSQQQGIEEVKTYLQATGEGLKIKLKVGVSPQQDIPELISQIQDALKEYVHKTVGVEVTHVEVLVRTISHEEPSPTEQ